MKVKTILVTLISTILASGALAAAELRGPASWTAPAAPFKIVGNVYEVGSEGITSLLIKTPDGLILIDPGMPAYAPQIVKNIRALGLDPHQIRWLLNSHAHFDHAGGLAELKQATGASVAAMAQDTPSLEAGTYPGDEANPIFKFAPVHVDRVLKDGDTVSLGGVILTAHLTAGHSPGCTTWTWPVEDGAKRLDVLYQCSMSVAANRLVGRPQYPGIVSDYRRTFATLKTLRADVFLAPHAEQFDLARKKALLAAGGPNPFVDSTELPRRVADGEAAFDKTLADQQAKLGASQ